MALSTAHGDVRNAAQLAQTHYAKMNRDVEFILALAKLETKLNHHKIAGDWLARGLTLDPTERNFTYASLKINGLRAIKRGDEHAPPRSSKSAR